MTCDIPVACRTPTGVGPVFLSTEAAEEAEVVLAGLPSVCMCVCIYISIYVCVYYMYYMYYMWMCVYECVCILLTQHVCIAAAV
jgi:hypothetical protein